MNLPLSMKSYLNEGHTGHLLNEMRRRKQKYGVVTKPLRRGRLCVGTGQGAASVFELLT
jgi:acetyl-CoA acetyltransferase